LGRGSHSTGQCTLSRRYSSESTASLRTPFTKCYLSELAILSLEGSDHNKKTKSGFRTLRRSRGDLADKHHSQGCERLPSNSHRSDVHPNLVRIGLGTGPRTVQLDTCRHRPGDARGGQEEARSGPVTVDGRLCSPYRLPHARPPDPRPP